MGLRARKSSLLIAVQCYVTAGTLTSTEAAKFEQMFRQCRSTEEQDQVRKALHNVMHGWRTGTDRYSRLLRDDDIFGEEETA